MNENFDSFIKKIASYVTHYNEFTDLALETSRLCLADSLGCAILSLNYPACTKLLGPIIKDTLIPHGSRVPGTDYILNPIEAAFNIGTMIRWLDFNDTWLAAEWGHPSDNLGGLLALTDYLSQNGSTINVEELLKYMIMAHEIQGIIALINSFNAVGLDHVILVKLATAAISTKILGGTEEEICAAISQAFIDGGPLRTYRHYPNTGSRKSWAAGDQTSRGLWLAWMTMKGEKGYHTPLTAPTWGFQEVFFKGKELTTMKDFGCYVMENILFKISFPAEFHAQTAVEAAMQLHESIKDKIEFIEKIIIESHAAALKIIDKKEALKNPADRDHCLQYMVAIALLFGDLNAGHYEEDVAKDPRIDLLRSKMFVYENMAYSHDYLDENKRSIANSLEIIFKDGSKSNKISIEYPLGHKRRRAEAVPLLFKKFEENLSTIFDKKRAKRLVDLFHNSEALLKMTVSELVDQFLLKS